MAPRGRNWKGAGDDADVAIVEFGEVRGISIGLESSN